MVTHRTDDKPPPGSLRDLVRHVLDEKRPPGRDFDACRAVLLTEPDSEHALPALCMLLEGLLADPGLDIDTTHAVVRVLKGLARGELRVGELL